MPISILAESLELCSLFGQPINLVFELKTERRKAKNTQKTRKERKGNETKKIPSCVPQAMKIINGRQTVEFR